jgi:hypothetical protein
VLVDMGFMRVMQVPVVQVVRVTRMLDGAMATAGSVLVVVRFVRRMSHGNLPFRVLVFIPRRKRKQNGVHRQRRGRNGSSCRPRAGPGDAALRGGRPPPPLPNNR